MYSLGPTGSRLTARRCAVVSRDHPEIEGEGASRPVRKLLQSSGWLYEGAINGIPGVDGLEDLVQGYSTQHRFAAIDLLINWQVAKAGAAGR
jgi:hypothetical protein